MFCRNVLIYFDQATKIGVLDRIAGVTERDGFLVLGGAETVVGLTDRFKPVPDKRGVYGQPARHDGRRRPMSSASARRRQRAVRRRALTRGLGCHGRRHRRGHAPRCSRIAAAE